MTIHDTTITPIAVNHVFGRGKERKVMMCMMCIRYVIPVRDTSSNFRLWWSNFNRSGFEIITKEHIYNFQNTHLYKWARKFESS